MATKVFTGALIDFFTAFGAGATDWEAVVQPAWILTDDMNGNSGTVTHTTGAVEETLFFVLGSLVDDATVPMGITMTAVRVEFTYGVTCSASTRLGNGVDKSIIVPPGTVSGNFDETTDPTTYFGGTTRADMFVVPGVAWGFASLGISLTQAVSISAYTVAITYTGGPEVTSVTPNTGTVNGGKSVTIRGTGFLGATGVEFGGAAATSVVIVDDFTITAVTSEHASGVVDVEVLSVAVGVGLYTYVILTTFRLDPLPERTPIQQGEPQQGRGRR